MSCLPDVFFVGFGLSKLKIEMVDRFGDRGSTSERHEEKGEVVFEYKCIPLG